MSHRMYFYKLQLVKEKTTLYEDNKRIGMPADAYELFKNVLHMDEEAEEVLQMFTLNTKNDVIGTYEISRGSLNSSVVHPREVFKRAFMNNAASIIIAHNHPSGDPTPSNEDINITKRLKECGKLLGIELLDHIIIGDDTFKSMKELGIV